MNDYFFIHGFSLTVRYDIILKSSDENISTWKNAWFKIKTIAPYLWPKRSILLQLRLISCFAIIMSGRAVNLFVPIYNKKIVDSVTDTPGKLRS